MENQLEKKKGENEMEAGAADVVLGFKGFRVWGYRGLGFYGFCGFRDIGLWDLGVLGRS